MKQNNGEFRESVTDFKVVFGGPSEIDAEALSASLDAIVRMTKTLVAETTPDAYAKIIVKPPKSGSVQLILAMMIVYAPTLFTKENYEASKFIYGVLKDIFKIKKHLDGEEPKQVISGPNEMSAIVNQSGNKLSVSKISADQYFKNATFDNCLVQVFNVLGKDEGRTDFEMQSSDGDLKIERNEYSNMSKQIITEPNFLNVSKADVMNQIIDVQLLLKKPDLLGNSKWGFVLDKNIDVEMKDEEFLERVHKGEIKMYAGIKILCRLEIQVILDERKNPVDTKYSILKVTGPIIEPGEEKQFFG